MTDTSLIELLEQQLEGLIVQGKDARAKENLFVKAQGIDIVIKKNQGEKKVLAKNLTLEKEALAELKTRKKTAVAMVAGKICEKLDEFLPIGNSFFEADEGLSIGWIYQDKKQPYNSLSGGQKQIFDAALENLLGSNIMIIEAGEIDKDHLMALLEDIAGNDKQVFINTWFDEFQAPEGVEVCKVGGE